MFVSDILRTMDELPLSAEAILTRQLRELRERRQLTQQQLADKLGGLGVEPQPAQATIARTEAGARGIGLDEALAFAAALDVSPSRLILPSTAAVRVAITPKLDVPASLARQWLRGQQALPGQDARTYRTDVSEEEWIALQDNTIQFVLARVQELIDATVADDREGMADAVDALNDELTRMRAARERGRP
jgi:transcriptional regulator with XRE-family HTH domain